jgi:ABC-type glycerol-3-phosphate transport system substrate-binding protein
VRVVNRNSANVDCAWEFIKFVASQDQMKTYAEATKLPPARKDLVGEGLVDMGNYKYDVFANAVPYSQSWFKGNFEEADAAVNETINRVAVDNIDQQTALNDLAKKLVDILKKNPIPD